MFGENEVENPRAPSPWDPFLSSPPSGSSTPETRARTGIPKLTPEVEEGNVEYKLKLTNITPARFARLCTQLKWRLLEGGGQAYYELGVADSGALIGLTRSDLEESLQTLEMMAGEIGASVIVVKEIEVPPIMVSLADKVSGYLDPDTGEWATKMTSRRSKTVVLSDEEFASSYTPTMSEAETEFSVAELTDSEDPTPLLSTLITPADSARASPYPVIAPYCHRLTSSNPQRPNFQSSPAIVPIDDDLALFSMEPEPDFVLDDEADDELDPDEDLESIDISVQLEINSVYKPRPVRGRQHSLHALSPDLQGGRRAHKNKEKKKKQTWHVDARRGIDVHGHTSHLVGGGTTTVAKHRMTQGKREQGSRNITAEVPPAVVPSNDENLVVDELVTALENVTVSVHAHATIPKSIASSFDDMSRPAVSASLSTQITVTREPRLIVEALVVRKTSIEVGFLDFSGFYN
ncbi:hypothetical protein ABKN59_009553 [Abortiporus biennis]